MREDRRDDLVLLIGESIFVDPGSHHGRNRENRLGTSARMQTETIHAGDRLEHPLRPVHEFKRSLHRALVLSGVQVREVGVSGEAVVDLRAVLHRTGTLPYVDGLVRTDVLLAQVHIVFQDPHLGHLGERGRVRPRHVAQVGKAGCGHIRLHLGKQNAALAGARQFEQDRLVPTGLVVIPVLTLEVSDRRAHV